jgi:TrmH family RNA methyltransferase
LQHRAERDRAGIFLTEGVRFVLEAVHCNSQIELVVVCPDYLVCHTGHRVLAALRQRDVSILEVTPSIWDRIVLSGSHQGIAAVVKQQWTKLSDITMRGAPIWIAVEQINSPGNFGSLLRTCEALGVAGVILLGDTMDPHEPAAVRATMGALFHLKFVRARHSEFAKWKRTSGFAAFGSSPHAQADFRVVNYCKPAVILLGSEQHGMTKEQEALCDEIVRIPMIGRSDSLNVGVAASILLYEAFSHRYPAVRDERNGKCTLVR